MILSMGLVRNLRRENLITLALVLVLSRSWALPLASAIDYIFKLPPDLRFRSYMGRLADTMVLRLSIFSPSAMALAHLERWILIPFRKGISQTWSSVVRSLVLRGFEAPPSIDQ